ncbi:MAG TPA: GGDEF domain-containing protein [Candidatus Acidoferrum sp.]|nr:GGDEF domain-containing protein [Candidatus Acidoferrum sp.]
MLAATPRPERGIRLARSLQTEVPVRDVLVFERRANGFVLIGGTGRGEGWAEIVETRDDEDPLIDRAWRSGRPVRTDGAAASHVVGPYWIAHSVIVPVGDHVVVFGDTEPIVASDAVILRVAAQTAAETGGVAAEKLLGDELELVYAVRALMAYRAETVRETARHIALVAARSLSCDVGIVQVATADGETLEAVRLLDHDDEDSIAGPDAAAYLQAAAHLTEPRVEQTVGRDPRLWQADVVSRLTIPIGTDSRLGALALGHSVGSPRGFTLLCQRIARALAEAAELLLAQAITREALATERAALQRTTRTDPLTGLANRTGWDEAVAALAATAADEGRTYAILSIDLDGLKSVNDRYGHAIGDAVIKGAANLLRTLTRDADTVARLGGDEFLVLLPSTDAQGAAKVARRIQRNARRWRVTDHGLAPQLSVGWSISSGADPSAAIIEADREMYAMKRRRGRAAARRSALALIPSTIRSADRRAG